MTAISCKNLNKTFTQGEQTIRGLDDVSISIEAGEFVSFIGPSGCGKTTFLRVVADLEHPTGGSVTAGVALRV